MKIKMTIEVDTDMCNFTDDEEKNWFENQVLSGNGDLILHSNEIGDAIGTISKVSDIVYVQ